MSKHVAVLMGGWSAEREISLKSGKACGAALEKSGYRVTFVDVQRDVAEVLAKLKPDVAFNVLHGCPGEDGTMQGILEILQIPYTHSGVLSSALAMDKPQAKIVMAAAGVPVAEGKTVTRQEAAKGHVMAPPYVIKPPAEGSSVGVYIVTKEHKHPPQELSRPDWPHGETLMVERYVPGLNSPARSWATRLWGSSRSSRRPVFTITSRNTPPAVPATFFLREFYQMFTNGRRCWP